MNIDNNNNNNDKNNTSSSSSSILTTSSSSSTTSLLPLRSTTNISNASAGGGVLSDNTNQTDNDHQLNHQHHHYHQHHHHQTSQLQEHHEFHIDDSILNNEHNHLQHHQNTHDMSPTIKLRRESAEDTFNHQNTESSGWNSFNFNTTPVTTSMNPSATSYMNQRNQPCLELNTSQAMTFNQTAQWPMSATSDTFSPTNTGGIDHIPDYNNPFALNSINQFHHVNPVLVSPGPLQHSNFPTSPPFSTSSSDGHDGRQNSTQGILGGGGRNQSPPFSAVANLLRRDGIRKKNARFDIPAERNLKTIDQLINATNDEAELKELKQQKRLLRNRQAALDSRQRKKQHTERLEEEKKHFSSHINDLEDALQECKVREGEWIREKEIWAVQQQQYHTHIEDLRMHQEELVRQHTIETGDLRRKNALLMEQLQRLESTAMSNAPSSHGISADYSDFDQMNISSWDNLSMAQEFTIENNNHSSAQPVQQPPKVSNTASSASTNTMQEPEKPAASALLLMLLLCGAWVASRNNTSGSNVLPAIPDEMRAASATVVDNLYKDSGVQLDGVNSVTKTISNPSSKTVLSVIESAGAFGSNLDNLHQRLITPSSQQLKDQAFSLTPSQYYEMTSGDARYQQAYYDHHRNSKTFGGPVQQDGSTLADTYTKSLLRDKVSTQILKDFARMVAQSNVKSPVMWKTESM